MYAPPGRDRFDRCPPGFRRTWSLQAYVWRRSLGGDETTLPQGRTATIKTGGRRWPPDRRPRAAGPKGPALLNREAEGKKKTAPRCRGAARSSQALGRANRCPGRWQNPRTMPWRRRSQARLRQSQRPFHGAGRATVVNSLQYGADLGSGSLPVVDLFLPIVAGGSQRPNLWTQTLVGTWRA